MEITALINHPEQMDRETLYDLRSKLALDPYFQTARLLMLQNLYLLHDQAFDEELRRAAVYLTDRRAIFNMIEAAHYQMKSSGAKPTAPAAREGESRTVALIDSFLDSIPQDSEEEEQQGKPRRRHPSPADAAVDYVAYLLECESEEELPTASAAQAPQMKGQDLIDNFLQQERGRITIELPDEREGNDDTAEGEADPTEEEYFTETLARIYIKQGRYQKAHEIIERLSKRFPQKNAYFADQLRFLEKLIINNNKTKK